MSEFQEAPHPFNRWIPVIACITIQLCLGTAYIWGVFQAPVMKALNCDNVTAALTFAILLGVLTVGSTFGGMIQDRSHPRMVIIIGGIIMGLGFILTSFTPVSAPWQMWITYGVMGGFGMGMVYTSIIATCQKWFPDKRGFITGVIVSALGFGGLVFTPIASILITKVGVMQTFTWIGLIFIVVSVGCAMLIDTPPVGYTPAGWTPPAPKEGAHQTEDFTPLEVLRTPQFYLVVVTFMLATAAGMMVIPYGKILGTDAGLPVILATSAVMIIAIFNALGRLFWGWLSDHTGRRSTLIFLALLAGTSILFVAPAKGYSLLVLIGLVAFSYGGFLGTYPVLTAEYWGLKNMGMNYGMVLLGFGVGAVASSYIVGFLKDQYKASGMTIAFFIASGAAVAAFFLLLLLKPPTKNVNTIGVKIIE